MSVLALGKSFLSELRKNVDKGANVQWMDGPTVIDDREFIPKSKRNEESERRWRAAREDGERRYDAAMQLAKERGRMAIGALLVAAGMASGWYIQAQKSSVETVFIPFDRIGDPAEVFIAKPNTPPDTLKLSQAKRVAKAMREITSDPNINSDNEDFVNRVVRSEAARKWDLWGRATKDQVTERRWQLVSFAQRSPKVMTVIWKETDWKDGYVVAERKMDGDFTIEYVAPKSTGEIAMNETGLFVTDMMVSEETAQ